MSMVKTPPDYMTGTNCVPGNKKPPRRPMIASFAYILDDMKEKYINVQFIDIDTPFGTLSEDDLKRLLDSRINCIVYDNKLYKLSLIDGDYYKYMNTTTDNYSDIISMSQISVSKTTGEYSYKTLYTEEHYKVNVLQREVDELAGSVSGIESRTTNLENTVTELQDNAIKSEAIHLTEDDYNLQISKIFTEQDN